MISGDTVSEGVVQLPLVERAFTSSNDQEWTLVDYFKIM